MGTNNQIRIILVIWQPSVRWHYWSATKSGNWECQQITGTTTGTVSASATYADCNSKLLHAMQCNYGGSECKKITQTQISQAARTMKWHVMNRTEKIAGVMSISYMIVWALLDFSNEWSWTRISCVLHLSLQQLHTHTWMHTCTHTHTCTHNHVHTNTHTHTHSQNQIWEVWTGLFAWKTLWMVLKSKPQSNGPCADKTREITASSLLFE